MRNLNQFIIERLKITKDSKFSKAKLDRSFIDILDFVIDDFEGYPFDSQWSLEFLYNIFCEAMPESAEVIHHAYDDNGKRIHGDMDMCIIQCGKNKFSIKEDNNGQLEFNDNDKWLDVFGSKRENELSFGLDLIEDVFNKSTHFKIKEDTISLNDVKNLLGINDDSNLYININYYNVNGWKVYHGTLYKYNKHGNYSMSNNIWISIVLPNNNDYTKYYKCYGAGLYGSKKNYCGKDENKFKDVLKYQIENHLYL